jgi:hypothetical protein
MSRSQITRRAKSPNIKIGELGPRSAAGEGLVALVKIFSSSCQFLTTDRDYRSEGSPTTGPSQSRRGATRDKEEPMNVSRQLNRARLVVRVTLCLLTLTVGLVNMTRSGHAQSPSLGATASPLQATLIPSNVGRGPSSGLVNFNVHSTGTDIPRTLIGRAGPGRGDSVSTQTSTVQTPNPDGSGTAGLSCGSALKKGPVTPSDLPNNVCAVLARCCNRCRNSGSSTCQCCDAYDANCGSGQ